MKVTNKIMRKQKYAAGGPKNLGRSFAAETARANCTTKEAT